MTVTAAKPSTRASWRPLPRRRPVRPPRAAFAIRAPLPGRTRTVLAVLSVLLPLAAWLVLGATDAVPARFLPAPDTVWQAGLDMARSGQLWTDTWATVQRIVYGFGLAILVSVPLGVTMGSFTAANAVLEPLSGLLRYLPAAAFTPLLLIWLGIEEQPKIALIFLGTVFFNMLMIADVVRLVPRDFLDVSYTLGARRWEVLWKVIVPHSLPGMIDAVRVNFAAAWNLVVVAELVNSDTGLGKRILLAQRFTQTDRIFAVLVVIAVVGVLTDVLLRLARNRIGRWV
ncbi:ABC transporter permease [Dactylosporangium fulvum]|uniref:ABC transporter permease n=1 Tax=Dactylosporangium fulvum TaxID=53359 RepID=A0ABY5W1L3_9ACTN|nr:ABC transporter permease [Dactylosporangium fulvum]UWP83883.1 ABC transporter permease [Dactylosporangium fulvum]